MSEAEAPLITEVEREEARGPASAGGSRSGDGGGGGGWRSAKRYQRRAKAAALVYLAEDGVGIPEDVLNDTRFERAMRFYFVYLRFDWLWSLNLFALILLNFLEKPLWCRKYVSHACDQRDLYSLGQLPYLSQSESLVYEGTTNVCCYTGRYGWDVP